MSEINGQVVLLVGSLQMGSAERMMIQAANHLAGKVPIQQIIERFDVGTHGSLPFAQFRLLRQLLEFDPLELIRRQALNAVVSEYDDRRVCLFCLHNHGLLHIQKRRLSFFRDGREIFFRAYHKLFPLKCSMSVHVDGSKTSAVNPSAWATRQGGN